MKQKDIVLIIVVVFVSGVLSFFISNWLFAAPKSRQQAVEVVDPVTTSFPIPGNKYFNSSSIDPTQLIQIGGTTNLAPFNGQ